MVKIFCVGVDREAGIFTFSAWGFEPEHEIENPDYCKSAPDFDDFNVPDILVSHLVGENPENVNVGDIFDIKG